MSRRHALARGASPFGSASLTLLATAGLLAGCAGLPKGDAPAADASKAAAPAPAPATVTATVTVPSTPAASAPSGPVAPGARPATAGGTAIASFSAAVTPAAPPAPPGSPPTFASIIKDAKRIEGPLTVWQKEDKIWLELMPDTFGKSFLLSPKIKNGIGEAWVLGGLMGYPINGAGGPQVVEFVRVFNTVRLQARNLEVLAKAGTPEALAVASSYSASLLGSTVVASQPHPDRKSILIEATPFFLADQMGIGMMLQRNLRQGYGLERSNSTVTAVRSNPQATVIEVAQHFVNGSPSLPMPGSLAALFGGPAPTIPRFLPDSRSLMVGINYSLSPLPATPMTTRAADPRLGLFSTTVFDFSDDLQRTPRQRLINRWRLEKKDPTAALSEPVTPITFWIDKNVPLAYRETVRAAVLEWNRAFEKIGFQNAIAVQQQPDDATWDTLDYGYSSVRWMMNADPAFAAIGPSHTDPRTGEILDADIAFEGMATRAARGERVQVLGGGAKAVQAQASQGSQAAQPSASFAAPFQIPASIADLWGLSTAESAASFDPRLCQHAASAAEQMGYAMDVLEARGELEPDSPVAQQFVLDYVKDSIMHEVGHALGLRHNFRASRVYTEAQLADVEFTRANGTTGSVMEYNAVNLARPGAPTVLPFQTTLGPYDYWAIEYAYKPMPAGTKPEDERAELQKIAARSSEPLLAYGTDEDAILALDPETLQRDLGSDPVVFAAKRLEIARDLFRRQETRVLPTDRDYAVLRRSINYALNDATRAVGVLVRQIGGVRTLRDFPGSGRDPLTPVPAKVQREALDLIAKAVLVPEGLSLSPTLQRRLAPDYLDRIEVFSGGTDYQVPERLLGLQSAVLGYLMSDVIAARILDSVGKFDRPAEAFQLNELYERLMRDVWVELGTGRAIAPMRRELQRDHVNRLALAVLRPIGTPRADARGLLREQTKSLLVRLQAAQGRSGLDAQTRAHLADSADTLRQALAAPMPRLSL